MGGVKLATFVNSWFNTTHKWLSKQREKHRRLWRQESEWGKSP